MKQELRDFLILLKSGPKSFDDLANVQINVIELALDLDYVTTRIIDNELRYVLTTYGIAEVSNVSIPVIIGAIIAVATLLTFILN